MPSELVPVSMQPNNPDGPKDSYEGPHSCVITMKMGWDGRDPYKGFAEQSGPYHKLHPCHGKTDTMH